MLKILFAALFFVSVQLSGFARVKLAEPLPKNEGEYHFQFKGKKYTFTIRPDGGMFISAPKKEGKPDYNTDLYLSYYSKVKDKNDNMYHHLTSMETKGKSTSKGFSVLITGKLGNGVNIKTLIQGNSSQMTVSVETDNLGLDKYLWFRVSHPEAAENMKKGAVLIKPEKGKSITHKCSVPYPTTNYGKELESIVVKKRALPDIVFQKAKAKGFVSLYQYSHFQGSDLNDPFHIHYRYDAPKWNAKDHTVMLSF